MSISNTIVFFLKLLLPSVLCFLIIYLGDGYNHFEIIIIPFSLLITLPNLYKKKYSIAKTMILSLIFSTATFIASIIVPLGIGYPVEYFLNLYHIGNTLSELILKLIVLTAYCVISPAIIFVWYLKIFELSKNKYTKRISYSTYLALIVTLFGLDINGSLAIASWQFIMALALQIIISQKELKTIFKFKDIKE